MCRVSLFNSRVFFSVSSCAAELKCHHSRRAPKCCPFPAKGTECRIGESLQVPLDTGESYVGLAQVLGLRSSPGRAGSGCLELSPQVSGEDNLTPVVKLGPHPSHGEGGRGKSSLHPPQFLPTLGPVL